MYASITNVSVSQLFMGSVIPGILLAGSLIVYALVYGKRNNLPAHEKQTPKQIGHAFKEGIWAPTEAAAVAVVYALIISLTVYRDMKLSELPQVFVEASVSTATIMMMVGLSKASSYVVVTSGLPQQLLDVFTSITSNRIVILLLLNLLFLIIGMLMADMDMQHLRSYRQLWKPVLLRLIVLPVILVCVAKYSGLAALAPHGETLIIISLLSVIAPSANIVPQFSQMFGRDALYASLINTVTMLLCIITMPLMITLFQM